MTSYARGRPAGRRVNTRLRETLNRYDAARRLKTSASDGYFSRRRLLGSLLMGISRVRRILK